MNTTPILRATNIVKKLGGKTILNDVSLDVHKGDVKVVIGPSGAGKSTFLQCLNYLLPPDTGDIWLEGNKVNAKDTKALCRFRQQVDMIFQDFNLFDHLTAEENVSIALRKVMGFTSASPSPAPSPWTPRSCFSTSPPPPSTPNWSAKCSRSSATSRTAA